MSFILKKVWKKWWVKWVVLPLLLLIGLFFALYASVYLGFWGKVPNKKELSNLSQIEASQVYDCDSVLIGKYFITDREAIPFKQLPKNLIHALIATEDARFYEHNGIDERSLLRVFFKTILMGNDSSGGGSTITLQLAKNLYGRNDYGFLSIVINKLRESIVASRLEDVYSKNEILTLYLNTVPFSGNTYGIESAARKFFNTSTKDLTLSQAATLVGTLKANNSYNPRLYPDRSKLRRNVVLHQMVKYGYISPKKEQKTAKEDIKIDYHNYASSVGLAPYFREQVKQKVQSLLAEKKIRKVDGTQYDLLKDGLKIYTTLNASIQKHAEASMRKHMSALQNQFEKSHRKYSPWRPQSKIVQNQVKKLSQYKRLKEKGLSPKAILDTLAIKKETELFNWKENNVKSISTIDSLRHYLKFLNTGLVSIDPHSGAIVAYIGGIDYRYFQYDHVVQSRREVGSTFKPFVYTAALEKGLEPCDYFSIRNVVYTDYDNWTPKNAETDMDPDMNYSMNAALSQSLNTIAVKVLSKTGLQNVIDQVHKMGIDQKIEHQPAIALGTSDIRLIDMAKAYSCYLNDGRPVNPYFISRIEDKNGKIIFEHQSDPKAQQAMSNRTQRIMIEMLKNVVDTGTAQRLRSIYHLRNELGGKTGTTQDNTDGWFVGLLPDLVTVTWVGNDNHKIKFRSTAIGQGAHSALPIFGGMLQLMNKDSTLNSITKGHFKKPSKEILQAMDCPPSKRNGFLKRIFRKDEVEKDFDKEEKKKGFFGRLFGG